MRGETVFVHVDLGQSVWAEITAESVAELGLVVGASVTCLIKATAVQIVD